MQKKKKNDEARSSAIVQNSIWLFLLASYISLFCNPVTQTGVEYRRWMCPDAQNGYFMAEHIFVNLALIVLWYMADEWFPRRHGLMRIGILVYLFAGRWVMMPLFLQGLDAIVCGR